MPTAKQQISTDGASNVDFEKLSEQVRV